MQTQHPTQKSFSFRNFFETEYRQFPNLVPPKIDEQTNKSIAKKLYEGTEKYSLRFFVDQFGEYLSEQLKDPNLTPKPEFQEFLKNVILFNSKFHQYFSKIRIVNFNYTNTFEKLYSGYLCSEDGTLDISTYHVHGSLDKNNLVLGTQNLPDKNDPFRIFTKETQRFRYETNKDYQKLLNELG